MKSRIGCFLLLITLGLATGVYLKTRPAATPAAVGSINGQPVSLEAYGQVIQLQNQQIYHELLLRQLILAQASRYKLALDAQAERKVFRKVFGSILAAQLTPEQRPKLEALCRQGLQNYQLEAIVCAESDTDYLLDSLKKMPFGELAEQCSIDPSRLQRGKIGQLTEQEVERRFGPEALKFCRQGPLKSPSPAFRQKERVLFLRVLDRQNGAGVDLETYLLRERGWSTLLKWAQDAHVDLYRYAFDESLLQRTFQDYVPEASHSGR